MVGVGRSTGGGGLLRLLVCLLPLVAGSGAEVQDAARQEPRGPGESFFSSRCLTEGDLILRRDAFKPKRFLLPDADRKWK